MLILGIETSCDETAAAVVSGTREIRSNVVLSQTAEHLPYGGVVPEIAARAHIEQLDAVIIRALKEANVTLNDLDGIAATGGPGLIGGVIVGCMTGKALASVVKKPFIAVNHLEGHALTARLTDNIEFPFLLLLVSGGHCQFLVVRGVGQYEKLGGTVDDALGEAFDKTAKMLGLGMPGLPTPERSYIRSVTGEALNSGFAQAGGPAVEKLAKSGNERAYHFSVPLKGRDGCDFSFSGLKTAVRKVVSDEWLVASRESDISSLATRHLPLATVADICASFQYTAALHVEERTRHALKMCHVPALVVAGGVAANQYLRGKLETLAKEYGVRFIAPPVALCTDNAAMIAWAGVERLRLKLTDGLDFEPRARWPLAEMHH